MMRNDCKVGVSVRHGRDDESRWRTGSALMIVFELSKRLLCEGCLFGGSLEAS
jgi:hypothetical protein